MLLNFDNEKGLHYSYNCTITLIPFTCISDYLMPPIFNIFLNSGINWDRIYLCEMYMLFIKTTYKLKFRHRLLQSLLKMACMHHSDPAPNWIPASMLKGLVKFNDIISIPSTIRRPVKVCSRVCILITSEAPMVSSSTC